MQWVVDGVLVSADRDLLVTLGLGFGLLVLMQVATAAIRSWAVLHLSATLNLQWLSNVFAHLMRLPVAWFEKRHTGDVWSRFARRAADPEDADHAASSRPCSTACWWWLTLAMMLLLQRHADGDRARLRWPSMRCCAGPSSGRCATRPKRRWCTRREQSSHFLESLRGVQSIKLFNRQADRQARFMNLVVDTMNADIATRKLELLFCGAAPAAVRARARGRGLGRRAAGDGSAAARSGMLFAFFAYKEQFAQRVSGADRQGRGAADAAAAGRAAGRHRAHRARRTTACRAVGAHGTRRHRRRASSCAA